MADGKKLMSSDCIYMMPCWIFYFFDIPIRWQFFIFFIFNSNTNQSFCINSNTNPISRFSNHGHET